MKSAKEDFNPNVDNEKDEENFQGMRSNDHKTEDENQHYDDHSRKY